MKRRGTRIAEILVRSLFRVYFSLVHRVRVRGLENIPIAADRLVIVSNHGSLLDGPLLWAFLPLHFKTIISRRIAERFFLRPFLSGDHIIKVETLNSYSLKHVIRLISGGTPVLIFPEGRRSTTGGFMKIYEGAGFLAYKSNASLLPIYIKNNYLVATSLKPGRKRRFARLTVVIGKARPPFQLGHLAVRERRKRAADHIYDFLSETRLEATNTDITLGRGIIRLCREYSGKTAYKDMTGKRFSYRALLIGAFALGSYFSKYTDKNVALLLPNVVPAVMAFLGLLLYRKVPAFLNYAGGVAPLQHMLNLADVGLIVTSREFLTRIGMKEEIFRDRELVFLEDVAARIGARGRLRAAWQSFFPGRYYRPHAGEAEETAAILFTSGSEGIPKGVALSNENILTNIHQCLSRLDVNDTDYLLNPLPLFHSFGLTAGTLMPLFAGARTFLYVSPLHFRTIPELAYRENCTILLGTNLFLNGYARRADPYDFFSLRHIYCGGEALLEPVFEKYARTYGKRVMTGYGVTECSPVISLNTSLHYEFGTVGKLLPGMEFKIVPVGGINARGGRVGRLHVKGKNAMKGYLKNEAANRKYLVEDRGWYDTGDIVEITDRGYLKIVGRRKRFAKVSGEMVSLTAIEEALAYAFGERKEIAVTSVPDPRRGERILLVTNNQAVTLHDVRDILRIKGFSELSQPRGIRLVRTIPKLATGKPDYPKLNEMIKEESVPPVPAV